MTAHERCSWWAVMAAALLGGCHRPSRDSHPPLDIAPAGEGAIRPLSSADSQDRSAAEDPLGFLKMCREHYLATVRDYRCKFHIRESPGGAGDALGPEQEIDVRFRERPFSVDMRWLRNPAQADRVNYVAGRWRRGDREMAMIYPSGLVGLLAPSGVKLDIHSPQVRAASRRPVDDFGFRRTLEIIIENCEKAASNAAASSASARAESVDYSLECIGEADLDKRPCLVFRRLLPYRGPSGPYPDRMLLVYIDREWLVPTACFSFVDDHGERPLGTYVTTSVRMNVGLTDEDFAD